MPIKSTVLRISRRLRVLALRALDTVPLLRRTVDELLRVEVIDRAMVVAAQALLALIPLLIVMGAFLPDGVTSAGLERFGDITGLSHASADAVAGEVSRAIDQRVRTQTGLVGLLVVVLSASSFARAVMRAYERVWEVSSVGGLTSRRRALAWLLGWLLALDLLVVAGHWFAGVGPGPGSHADLFGVPVDVARGTVQLTAHVVVLTVLWVWTLRMLLTNRVPRGLLLVPAAL